MLAALGLFFPETWREALSRSDIEGPITGMGLFRVTLGLEGLLLLVLARVRWTPLPPVLARLPAAEEQDEDGPGSAHIYWALLLAITLLGLGLRLYRLDSGLWLDEIATVQRSQGPLLDLLTVYGSTNNHLLNSILIKGSIALFGDSNWAIRLPVVVLGVATIPVVYWLARCCSPKSVSLFAALLLAVSFHHIFFSQNARGYTGYMLFSLLSTVLFVTAIKDDKPRTWMLYVAATFLNFATMLIAGFVVAGHVIIGALALIQTKRRGVSPMPLFWRFAAVFSASGLLVLQLYVLVIPQALSYVDKTYNVKSTGFEAFSLEFLAETIRAISLGFGPGALFGAIPFLLIAGAGFVVALRRNWIMIGALALPGVLTAVFLLVAGLTFSQRFFLLWLPLAVISAVVGLHAIAGVFVRKTGKPKRHAVVLTGLLVLLGAVGSAASLPHYYRVPKQNFSAPVEFLEEVRKPGQIVIAIHTAELGIRHATRHLNAVENVDYFYVRSVPKLKAVMSTYAPEDVFLVTTFPRALRIEHPDLADEIGQTWQVIKTYPGTIGDGDVSVWRAGGAN